LEEALAGVSFGRYQDVSAVVLLFFQLRPSPLFSAWNAENDIPQPYERLSTRDYKTFDLSISIKEAWPLRTAYSTRAWDA
jgi:hypothetical protein